MATIMYFNEAIKDVHLGETIDIEFGSSTFMGEAPKST